MKVEIYLLRECSFNTRWGGGGEDIEGNEGGGGSQTFLDTRNGGSEKISEGRGRGENSLHVDPRLKSMVFRKFKL